MAEAEDTDADTPAPKSPTNKILPIILVVNTLLMTGVLIFVMKRPAAQVAGGDKDHGSEKDKDKSKEKEHGESGGKGEGGEHAADSDTPGPSMKLEAFTVQVRAVEGDRYAHMTVELEIASELDKKSFETRMPRIRDAIIGYVADRSEDELRGSEGLGQVKQALTKKIDEIVPGHRVRGLFITEFIIQ